MINLGVTKRSRHYDIEWFKMHDLIEQKELTVQWVPTEDNLADFFTKKLPPKRFEMLRDKLMGASIDQGHFDEPTAKVVVNMLRALNEPSDNDMMDWGFLNMDVLIGGTGTSWPQDSLELPVYVQGAKEKKIYAPEDLSLFPMISSCSRLCTFGQGIYLECLIHYQQVDGG